MATIFKGIFESNKDIIKQFEIEPSILENINILFAGYDCWDYQGQTYVIYESQDKLYLVIGSHCSCNGIEGLWDPEEISWEVLKTINIDEEASFAKEFKEFIDKKGE